ncbi:MAG: hypothetical protein IPG45_10555 [Deltaproteobacteria bacterium]|nr:hypothetical protein [Deltaproteobacteria bacterium]
MKLLLVPTLALASLLVACGGPNLCARKHAFMSSRCTGGDVTYSEDTACENKIKSCNPGQLAQMEGYVACLEGANQCSLDVMARCAEQYPGGVNLYCGG